MVPVRVRQQNRRAPDVISYELIAQFTQARTGIEYDALGPSVDLEATRIAAESNVIGRGTSDAAADTPKIKANTHGQG